MSKELIAEAKKKLQELADSRKDSDTDRKLLSVFSPIFNRIIDLATFNKKDMAEALSKMSLKVNIPDIHIPKIEIPKMPDIRIPEIKIPKSEIKVTIPDIKIPEIKPPKVVMPDEMKVTGEVGLRDVDRKNPLPVILYDNEGKPQVWAMGGGGRNKAGDIVQLESGENAQRVAKASFSENFSATAVTTGLIVREVSDFNTISVHVVSTGTSGSLVPQFSNDGANWVATTYYNIASGATGSSLGNNMTTANIFVLPVHGKFFRINITGISAGTASGSVFYYTTSITIPASAPITSVNQGVNLTQVSSITVGTGGIAGFLGVGGTTANDAVDAGNPVKIGGQARTTNPTAVAGADRVNAMFDDLGRQVVVSEHVRDLVVQQQTQIVNTAAETTILTAGAAGVFHDITSLVVTNASATSTTITIKDSTGGTTRMILDVGALGSNSAVVIPFSKAMTQTSTENNWTATSSSAVVTINYFVQAVKNI